MQTDITKPLFPMREAQRLLGVRQETIRKWEKLGKIKCIRTPTNFRLVPREEIERLLGKKLDLRSSKDRRVLVIYGRVSSHEQKSKGDLERQVKDVQKKLKSLFSDETLIVTDIGSGLSDKRRGLCKILEWAKDGKFTDMGISYKGRLTRFGFGIMEKYLSNYGVKIHIVNGRKEKESLEQELVEDMLSIVTSFSGELYGMRSRKTKKIENLIKREVMPNADNGSDQNRR